MLLTPDPVVRTVSPAAAPQPAVRYFHPRPVLGRPAIDPARASVGLRATGLTALAACAATCLATATPAAAATYFVDFATGSDQASGLSAGTAWKRAPGDSRAGKGPRSIRLQPGDTILFRGGVAYRGTVVIRSAGRADAPIRYVGNGWGTKAAILDGAEPVSTVRSCRSARDCGGEPSWQALHKLSLDGDIHPTDGLFQGERPLTLAAPGEPLAPGTMRTIPGARGRSVVVHPWPELEAHFASGAARVGFLVVAGGHVEISGFAASRFAAAPRFGPYAGTAVVQLQPLPGVRLQSSSGIAAILHAPPIGPAIAGVTSGPI